jgi:AcrR family transcriptional regulator
MTSASEPRRRGEVRTRELLEVTIDLAADVGYRGLTVEKIAREAGVGKHTIYRRWSSLSELLLDALSHVWVTDLDYHDTGSIRGDLHEQFLRSTSALSSPPLGPIFRAVITEAQSDEKVRDAIHTRFMANIEKSTLELIRLAQRRGQLKEDVDLEYPAEVLSGTLTYRWLLSTRPVDERVIDGLIDFFLDAYGEPEAGEE